ncbi:alpha-glucosidase [Nocardioides ungokensis]|uniref:alpha-glucosidase n=1 Tax=Nocardioides ungokensis TaxID=1643322 RepID=UPI001C60CB3D
MPHTDAPWWTTSVVYQVYPRSFADSDGDGIGDLAGITGRLDHLERLGVDVLWLSPIYPSPQDDNGYDISDYQGVDPLFGTLPDLDELIAQAHARGIRVVMDLVVNHTSDEHPWFVESRSSTDNPKRDWYWWRPARPGTVPGEPGAEPTNWGSFFSGPTWEYDETTGEYYLHLFSRKQPDLNWENPEVRRAVHQMMRWWLDRGVDGFRMDVINMLSKDLPPRDGVVPTAGARRGGATRRDAGGRGALLPVRPAHPRVPRRDARRGRRRPRGHAPDRRRDARRHGRAGPALHRPGPPRGGHGLPVRARLPRPGDGKWDVRPLELTALKRSLGRWQEGLAEVGWNSLYWNNHDQPRAVSRFGDDGEHRVRSAKLLGTVLHLHRGTPYVYQGEELGMANAPFAALEDFRDIEALNHYRHAVALGADPDEVLAALRTMGRDNARTPMQWDASPHAGFTTGTPWIPVNPDHVEVNAEAALADPDSVFHHYRRLIELRRTVPAVALGDFTMLLPDDPVVYASREPGASTTWSCSPSPTSPATRCAPTSPAGRSGCWPSCCWATSRTRPVRSSRPGRPGSTGARAAPEGPPASPVLGKRATSAAP